MAIILPHGVLFPGGAEERIRTQLLKDGHIDTVIGLPANLFYSTGIPVCIQTQQVPQGAGLAAVTGRKREEMNLIQPITTKKRNCVDGCVHLK